jgi:hypothetical protein
LLTLGVDEEPAPGGLSEEQRSLRVALRAKARQLGGLDALVGEVAYEQWHRMLFARFLAENGLLVHPDGVVVSLEDCRELAPGLGEADEWMVAARFAASMLPGVFRRDDPSLEVRFAQEGRVALERILAGLPSPVFTAQDSLGWVYQFWQTEAKDEVNRSERKIGGADLAPVTQLFTEHYMVLFLLENSLGAWWASRHPDSVLLGRFEFLRRVDDGSPAAGTFEGWPERVAEVTVMDPCCGSGHFLVAAFEMLCQMRMEEEGLDTAAAGDAVLRDNLFGLELDARCTQIAAFAVALAAWRAGGYRELPAPNIACSGIRIAGQFPEWKKLARGGAKLEAALYQLFELFQHAPDLGSLIDPVRELERDNNLLVAPFEEVQPLLEKALARETTNIETKEAGIAAAGIADAAQLLARTYTLIATNVPYLGRGKQSAFLAEYAEERFPDSKQDLATMFLQRALAGVMSAGSVALVIPQAFLALDRYRDLRMLLLQTTSLRLFVQLGARAFESISGEVVNVGLGLFSKSAPGPDDWISVVNAVDERSPAEKGAAIRRLPIGRARQLSQLDNPQSRLTFADYVKTTRLSDLAETHQGIATSDGPRFVRKHWELPDPTAGGWCTLQSAAQRTAPMSGREDAIFWEDGRGRITEVSQAGAPFRGQAAWGCHGVAIAQMANLSATLYTGERFDGSAVVVVPKRASDLAALWQFLSSDEFFDEVRRLDSKLRVSNSTIAAVPFDIERWQRVAKEAGPLPEPFSDDPTQWLFKGHPKGSTKPLQVAVARLVGYRWPDQRPDDLDELVDADGIVSLPALAGELGASERLRRVLERAYRDEFSPQLLGGLLDEMGAGGKSLEEWLRDGFFDAHLKVFEQRPFVWQIWDGRRDGFSVLVNYHRLDRQLLEKLTYATLGSWIETQRADASAGRTGADLRLAAAQQLQSKLALILEGEKPYDIFVRWKSLSEQPIGWDPDLDDGVRLNIRPLLEAGALRRSPKIKWTNDRGTNPDGSERHNDIHLTLAEKRAARGGS